MLKKILLGLCGLFAIVVILVVLLGSRVLDSAVREGVTNYGPRFTQTPVELGHVAISPWDGEGSLRDLVIGNPEGFEGAYAVRLPEAAIAIDVSTLLSETIVIRHLSIKRPQIHLETNNETLNLRRIQQNIERSVGADEPDTSEPGSGEPGKKFVVREFVLEGGRILMEEVGADVSIPTVRLENIGTAEGGISARQVLQQILETVLRQGYSVLGDQAAALIDSPGEGLGAIETITDKVEEWFGGDEEEDENPNGG